MAGAPPPASPPPLAHCPPIAPSVIVEDSAGMKTSLTAFIVCAERLLRGAASLALPRAAGACASIRHLKSSQAERNRHKDVVATVRARLMAVGIPVLDNPSHIIPVMVGDAKKCKWISDWLLDNHGIYVQPINYPTVARGTERLRITPSPVHTDADIERLVSALTEIWSQCALARVSVAA